MTGIYDVGQEGTGAAPDGWRGIHAIETGFIRQFGYKQMKFTFKEVGLWAESKTLVPVFIKEELSLWNQSLEALDILFTLTESIIVT